MVYVNPDLEWYESKSKIQNVAKRCRFANIHNCPRYYGSLRMLGEEGEITKINPEKIKELDAFWDKSGLLPPIAEYDTGISSGKLKSTYTNFCPEVMYDRFGLFVESLFPYIDDIDKEHAYNLIRDEKIPDDWRGQWENVKPMHYLDCRNYTQLENREVFLRQEALSQQSTNNEILSLKPSFYGITLDIKKLYKSMRKLWKSKIQ
jgi:hypothetical protein